MQQQNYSSSREMAKPIDGKPAPLPLRAVLRIATSSPELLLKFCPYIHPERKDVVWDQVFAEDLSDGSTAAVHWAYAIWTGEASSRDPFTFSYSMDKRLALAVWEALGIAWGILGDETR